MNATMRKSALWACWGLLGLWAVAATLMPGTAMEESLTPIPMAYMLLAILHAGIGFGWRGALAMIVAAYALGFAAECTSIHTGFPFGWYDHTDVLGVKFAKVPLFIPIGFFAITYFAWMIARPIVGCSLLWTPVVTALIASAFDFSTDAIGATVHGYWIYRYPTGIFGVPLTNYLGWILTTWAIGLAFGLLASRFDRTSPGDRGYWAQPALFWAIAALQFPFSYYVQRYGADSAEVVTRGARSWMVADIYEGAVIVALLTMLPPALMALARLRDGTIHQ
jgi:putative membrane protein